MSKNPTLTNLDGPQALKRVFDDANDAVRVVQVFDQEIQIELNAEDGDSVKALPESTMLSSGLEMDAKRLKSLALYASGVCSVEVSPVDLDNEWYVLVSLGVAGMSAVTPVCARRVRVVGEGKIVGQS